MVAINVESEKSLETSLRRVSFASKLGKFFLETFWIDPFLEQSSDSYGTRATAAHTNTESIQKLLGSRRTLRLPNCCTKWMCDCVQVLFYGNFSNKYIGLINLDSTIRKN